MIHHSDSEIGAPFDFFMLRAPSLPVQHLTALMGGEEDRGDDDLIFFFQKLFVQDALQIASPTLYQRLVEYLRTNSGRIDTKLRLSLLRYAIRMCTRCTPFGLFAGYAVGRVAKSTCLRLGSQHKWRVRVAPDPQDIYRLVHAWARKPELMAHLRWGCNSTISYASERLFYFERQNAVAGGADPVLSALTLSPYIRLTLQSIEKDPSLSAAAASLKEFDADLDAESIGTFIEGLIDLGLLESDLEPPVTGCEPFAYVKRKMASYVADVPTHSLHSTLSNIGTDVEIFSDRWNSHFKSETENPGSGANDRSFQAPSRAVNATLRFSAEHLTLRIDKVSQILQDVSALLEVDRSLPDPLEDFREQLTRRHETGWVSLIELMDPERGIAFGTPLTTPSEILRDMPAPGQIARDGKEDDPWTTLLERLISDVLSCNGKEVSIKEPDVEGMRNLKSVPSGRTGAALITLLQGLDGDSGRNDPHAILHSAGGRSAADLLGRFSIGDPELAVKLREIAVLEQSMSPHEVLAEVCHLPMASLGAVLQREAFRDYEIPYFGRSSLEASRQIPIHDLLVSAQKGRVYLYSRRLRTLVRPMISNAHNFQIPGKTLPIYQLLAYISAQGMPGFTYRHPPSLKDRRFLPRMRYRSLILSPARWLLRTSDVQDLSTLTSFRTGMTRFMEQQCVPSQVRIGYGDRKLSIDLAYSRSHELLWSLLRQKTSITIEESLLDKQCCISSPRGAHANEIVLPYSYTSRLSPGAGAAGIVLPSLDIDARKHLPFESKWIYVKLYCSHAAGDGVLQSAVKHLRDSLIASGKLERWFFVRYQDPDPHLRVRLRAADANVLLPVDISNLLQTATKDGAVWKIQYDSYMQEVERYGGDQGIELCEELFEIDSNCALEMIGAVRQGGKSMRWQAALLGMHRWITTFQLDFAAAFSFVSASAAMNGSTHLPHQEDREVLSRIYRAHRRTLEDLVIGGAAESAELNSCLQILDARARDSRKIVDEILVRISRGKIPTTIETILQSIIHMSMNRMFFDRPKHHEVALYGLLRRIYVTRAARG